MTAVAPHAPQFAGLNQKIVSLMMVSTGEVSVAARGVQRPMAAPLQDDILETFDTPVILVRPSASDTLS